MAEKSLSDITKGLAVEQKSTTTAVKELNNTFTSYFTMLKRQEKDAEEDRREKRKAANQRRSSSSSAASGGGLLPRFFLGAGIGSLIAPLTGGLLAIAGVMAGLRGWELDAIKKIKTLVKTSIPNTIYNGVVKFRNSVYRIFGLTPEGLLSRDAQGRFTRTPPIRRQIEMRMNALRIRVLKIFGIGADGKLLSIRDEKGLFKKNIIGRVTFQIKRLLSPLMKVSEGVAKFATGTGARLFDFIRTNITPGVTKIIGIFGKILRPVAVIWSLWKGVEAFMNSDESNILGRIGDFASGFWGDFIGAPLNLLKSAVNYIWDNVFGVTRDENGNVTSEGWASWASQKMSEFDFVSVVGGIAKLPFTILSELWKLLTEPGYYQEQTDRVYNKITDWVTRFVNWFGGFLPDMSAIGEWAKETAKSVLPESVYEYFFPQTEVERMREEMSRRQAEFEYQRELNEFKAPQLNRLRELDTDGDGAVSSSEIFRANQSMGPSALKEILAPFAEERGFEVSDFYQQMMADASQSMMGGFSSMQPIVINNVDNSNNSSSSSQTITSPQLEATDTERLKRSSFLD